LANGYTHNGADQWSENNTSYNSIPLAQADIAAAEDTNALDHNSGYRQWKVTAMVKQWADNPEANYGLMINSDNSASADSYRFFAASEAADAGTRPRLEIKYTIPEPLDPGAVDNDGDGYTPDQGDCNDSDPSIYPGAAEICGDGIDQNCDGTDEICPEDMDQDGDGYTPSQGDCNDNDASVYPGAEEICGDGIDQDCDGSDLACPQEDDTEQSSDSETGDDGTTEEETTSEQSGEMTLEFQELEINHDWKSVTFNNIFYDPVVIAKPMSLNGSHPGVVRVKNLNWEGFDVRIQEWDYLDGSHTNESAGYIAVEAGRHELPNGIQMEAGDFETNSTIAVSFSKPFNHKPVVVCSVTSENEFDAVTGRIYNVTKDGFEFELQEQEANKKEGHYTPETVSFIACEPSSDTIGDVSYIVDTTFDEVTDDLYPITFYPSFQAAPVFIADMQTLNGSDPANVRWQNKDQSSVGVLIHEEASKDAEMKHITEVVGYMVFHLNE
jgi:hypothetical protein